VTHEALFGLLATTGMRIGEAVGLERDDVDLGAGVIMIREAKFYRSRLVPLHPSPTAAMSCYSAKRDSLCPRPRSTAFFLSGAGTRLERSGVDKTIRKITTSMWAELEPHLLKEERVLFPAIRALAGGARDFPFGLVRNPIRMMSLDHDRAGDLLAELRAATDGYRVPDDGCASYHSLYERLERLETDTHRHIHLENNVLFPAAMAVEDA